jgi:hypothetical protein
MKWQGRSARALLRAMKGPIESTRGAAGYVIKFQSNLIFCRNRAQPIGACTLQGGEGLNPCFDA